MALVSVYGEQRVRTLPFRHLGKHIDVACLAVSHVHHDLLRIHCPSDFSFDTIPYGKEECHIAFRHGLKILRPPLAGSPESGALYWIVHPSDNTLLLLQYMPPDTKTSVHWHAEEHETFHVLRGSCSLLMGNANDSEPNGMFRQLHSRRLTIQGAGGDQHAWVPPYTVHQLVTFREPVLNCIVIRNTKAQTLREIHHCYARWSR